MVPRTPRTPQASGQTCVPFACIEESLLSHTHCSKTPVKGSPRCRMEFFMVATVDDALADLVPLLLSSEWLYNRPPCAGPERKRYMSSLFKYDQISARRSSFGGTKAV
ncbi:hypothetical protein ZHAS_00019357 [Anopheles sinensis]|uniref:Uncharacterized protein n=1 Tax=Anopheles sinensis TaxID=74873 RepID=A0A084WM61_ANOSI|nr:hypothetical protein ZHAS_00019357 [Anopheles sinensis]